MKKDAKKLLAKLSTLGTVVRRHTAFGFVIILAGLFGFLVMRVGTLARAEPTDAAVQEKLGTTTRPKIDTDTLSKIQNLEQTNVEIQTLFQQARDNPFQDQ